MQLNCVAHGDPFTKHIENIFKMVLLLNIIIILLMFKALFKCVSAWKYNIPVLEDASAHTARIPRS